MSTTLMGENLSDTDKPATSLSVNSDSDPVIITNEKINREIINRNPMCTGREKIHESLNDRILVGWDGPADKKNPRNWPLWRRLVATVVISLCTTSMYMGAAIVTPAQEKIQEHFHTTRTKAALDITLFVWGYGLGSLWFTPMSEIPFFRGRNPTYFACQLIFCVLQIPTALTSHIGAFAVLRFLSGIFASPPLSTAAATLSDMWDMPALVVALISWAFGTIAGPFIGPLIGAALTINHPFSYIFWYMLALSGGMLIFMLLLLPETSEQELLMRKAIKLRKTTGNNRYIAPGEILLHVQTPRAVLYEMFFKPIKMTVMEPVLLLMDIHIGLIYSTMYLSLEAMPIAYIGIYHFNGVELGLAFLVFLAGAICAAVLYLGYIAASAKRLTNPETVFGPSATFGAILLPIGQLLWGWLCRQGIHWAAGFTGNFFFVMGAFIIFQSYFAIIGTICPPSLTGSAFASNNIVRSLMGGAFPLFGPIVFEHTAIDRYPIGWGCTIIAFIAILLIPFPIYLTLKGKSLRERSESKFSRE